MGLDGGTVISRSDVLRGQSWRMSQQDTSRSTRGGSVQSTYQEQQLDEQTRRTTMWTTCALSGLPLCEPVVADVLGQLYNRQAVLEHLLAAKAAKESITAAAATAAAIAATTVAAATVAATAAAAIAANGNSALPSSSGTGAAGTSLDVVAAAMASTTAPAGGAGTAAAGARQLQLSAAAAADPATAAASRVRAASEQVDPETAAARLRYENQLRTALAAEPSARQAAAAFEHLTSLKDVFAVHLTPADPQQRRLQQQQQQLEAAAGGAVDAQQPSQTAVRAVQHRVPSSSSVNGEGSKDAPSPWVCPVTLLPCGSKHPFSALRACGHVLSDRALAAITPAAAAAGSSKLGGGGRGSSSSSSSSRSGQNGIGQGVADAHLCCCPVCDTLFDPVLDKVLINGSKQHMDQVRAQLRAQAAARVEAKLNKKRKRGAAEQSA